MPAWWAVSALKLRLAMASAVGLRSMPVRYLFLDEVDGYPLDVEGEGDAISLAEARKQEVARRDDQINRLGAEIELAATGYGVLDQRKRLGTTLLIFFATFLIA